MIKLSLIKEHPKNPRVIKDDKFTKLIESIKSFPEMMVLRPIVVNEDYVCLGGNMRRAALMELDYLEIPDEWIKVAKGLTEDQQKEFMIKDNSNYGEWDYDLLVEDFDFKDLQLWGIDMPVLSANNVEIDTSNFTKSAETYLNNSIRQIVLLYTNETHQKVLSDFEEIGKDFNIEDDNSAVVLKLIELYKNDKTK